MDVALQLCLLYNRLFRFRFRNRATAEGERHRTPEAYKENYFRMEMEQTAQRLNRLRSLGYPIDVSGCTVVDFGCGYGGASCYLAELGARSVIGLDINPKFLSLGEEFAHKRGLAKSVRFLRSHDHQLPLEPDSVDWIYTEHVMEHLMEPSSILAEFRRILRTCGRAVICFGPPWYHPHGIHLWEIFPAPGNHLLFPEETVVKARHLLKQDGGTARSYRDMGLNQLSVARFRRLVADSGLKAVLFNLRPAWKLWPLLSLPFLKELCTAEIESILEKPSQHVESAASRLLPR